MYVLDKITQLVANQTVPGVSYAFLDDEKIVQKTLGVNTWFPVETPLPAKPLYDLASLTKVIGTTTVLLHLIENKIIDYDTPIIQWLPQFNDSRVTLRHLMTHTSGIRGYIPHRDHLHTDELIQAILKLPVTDDFEKVIKYTDTGPILAGLLIEKIYDQPIQTVIDQIVLQPLGLVNATFTPNKTDCVVTTTRKGQNLQGIVQDPKARQLGKHCGSAGMFASLEDLIRFSQFMLGQLQIDSAPITQTTIQKLYQSYTPLKPGRSFGWDLRWNRYQNPVLYHTGYTGNFLLLDRFRQQALIVLSNRIHPFNDNQRFLAVREAIIELFLQN